MRLIHQDDYSFILCDETSSTTRLLLHDLDDDESYDGQHQQTHESHQDLIGGDSPGKRPQQFVGLLQILLHL